MTGKNAPKKADSSPKKVRQRLSRRQLTEEKIFNAAVKMFAQHGFDRASFKLIAQAAKVNEALIVRYFGSKHGLLIAVISQHIIQEQNYIHENLKSGSIHDIINEYLLLHRAQKDHAPEFMRIAFAQSLMDKKIRNKIEKNIPMQGNPDLIEKLEASPGWTKRKIKVDAQSLAFMICMQELGVKFLTTLFPDFPKAKVAQSSQDFAEIVSAAL
jgi:AcrR family transcriptional regulator